MRVYSSRFARWDARDEIPCRRIIRGSKRPENLPLGRFSAQSGPAGPGRGGPYRTPANFCLCMLSIRVQYDVTGNKAASTASGQADEVGHAARKRAAKTGGRPEKMRKLIFPACRRLSYARKLSLRPSIYRRRLFAVAFRQVRPPGFQRGLDPPTSPLANHLNVYPCFFSMDSALL